VDFEDLGLKGEGEASVKLFFEMGTEGRGRGKVSVVCAIGEGGLTRDGRSRWMRGWWPRDQRRRS
jgi:hypothetical protein